MEGLRVTPLNPGVCILRLHHMALDWEVGIAATAAAAEQTVKSAHLVAVGHSLGRLDHFISRTPFLCQTLTPRHCSIS